MEKLNTEYEFEFSNGEKTEMTLTFYKIYQLKSKNRKLYDRYNKIMIKGPEEELEAITVLYTAYVCAHLDQTDIMNEEEFMIACGSNREAVNNAVITLTTGKKA